MIKLSAPSTLAMVLAWIGGPSQAALVDISFTPSSQSTQVGEIVEINLVVSSTGPGAQPFAALDAIIGYDPTKLILIGAIDDHAGARFFVQGFLPDPDDINDDITDGEALFTALSPPGNPVPAPPAPALLIVTTLQFVALAETPATEVFLIPQLGQFGQTRVLLSASNITGDISGTATVTIVPVQGACCLGCECFVSDQLDCQTRGGLWKGVNTTCDREGAASVCATCLGDANLDEIINVDDLLLVINAWGPASRLGCQVDFDNNGTVNVDDLLIVINAWGPCPP